MAGREKNLITFCHYHIACCRYTSSNLSPSYWVPARRCLIVLGRDQHPIGVNGRSCRQRRRVCPAKSWAHAFKGAGKGKRDPKIIYICCILSILYTTKREMQPGVLRRINVVREGRSGEDCQG